jgi:hypothetical protein|tara:strand:+ start:220 stop:540 length:321 start_codon:yes stop_codon:yes gene_type:complete
MATTFTWAVNTLDRELSDGYVSTVHYTVNAADDTYSSGAYGSVGLERPETLIPYADLTESQVIEWVKTALGGDEKVTEIEAALQKQLDEQRTPTKGSGTPWVNAEA